MAKKKKHQRSDGRFEYKCTVGHRIDGRGIRKSFYSSISYADAKKQAEAYKRDKAIAEVTGDPVTPVSITFAEWSQKWLRTYKKPFVSASTYHSTYEYAVYKHLIPYFGATKLNDIKPADIQLFFADQSRFSKSTLKKLHNTLSAIFEAAIDNDIALKNPTRFTQLKSDRTKKVKKTLTDEQMETVKAAATGRLDAVAFLLETGLRRGELLGLMWSDIDFTNESLTIQRSVALEKSIPAVHPPKHGSFRTIPLMPAAMEIIRRQPRRSLYVFPAPAGCGYEDPNHFSRRLRAFFEVLPEECRCSAHELRHSYASQLMRRGVDIYTISKLLGHRDITVTAAVYVHPDVEAFRSELRRKNVVNMSSEGNTATK